jgi:hypothetical protein
VRISTHKFLSLLGLPLSVDNIRRKKCLFDVFKLHSKLGDHHIGLKSHPLLRKIPSKLSVDLILGGIRSYIKSLQENFVAEKWMREQQQQFESTGHVGSSTSHAAGPFKFAGKFEMSIIWLSNS